jgi:hypothetical protein
MAMNLGFNSKAEQTLQKSIFERNLIPIMQTIIDLNILGDPLSIEAIAGKIKRKNHDKVVIGVQKLLDRGVFNHLRFNADQTALVLTKEGIERSQNSTALHLGLNKTALAKFEKQYNTMMFVVAMLAVAGGVAFGLLGGLLAIIPLAVTQLIGQKTLINKITQLNSEQQALTLSSLATALRSKKLKIILKITQKVLAKGIFTNLKLNEDNSQLIEIAPHTPSQE